MSFYYFDPKPFLVAPNNFVYSDDLNNPLNSLAGGIERLLADIRTGMNLNYAADTGVANAYVVNLNPAPTEYSEGLTVWLKALAGSTGPSTIKVNDLDPVPILKIGHYPLAAGDITANYFTGLKYTDGAFQIITQSSDSMQDAVNAENSRIAAETAQGLAEDAQAAAETAQGAAETAQGLAEIAQGAAETAQGAAETAETGAETAQGLAETAKGLAEDAQVAAEAAAVSAEHPVDNDIINGDMLEWHRGTTVTGGGGTFSADRFCHRYDLMSVNKSATDGVAHAVVQRTQPKAYFDIVQPIKRDDAYERDRYELGDTLQFSVEMFVDTGTADCKPYVIAAWSNSLSDLISRGNTVNYDGDYVIPPNAWIEIKGTITIDATPLSTDTALWFSVVGNYTADQAAGTKVRFRRVELYKSTVERPVRRITKEENKARCQAYTWVGTLPGKGYGYRVSGDYVNTGISVGEVTFPVTMIQDPELSIVTEAGYSGCVHSQLYGDRYGFVQRVSDVSTNALYRATNGVYMADAEIRG